MAAIEVQLDQISNDKSIISVFIQGRQKVWEAHSTLVDVVDNDGNPAKRRDIKTYPFLRKIMDDYLEVDDQTPMREALDQLKKVFGNEYDALLQVEQLTQLILRNMRDEKYVVNNYKLFGKK